MTNIPHNRFEKQGQIRPQRERHPPWHENVRRVESAQMFGSKTMPTGMIRQQQQSASPPRPTATIFPYMEFLRRRQFERWYRKVH